VRRCKFVCPLNCAVTQRCYGACMQYRELTELHMSMQKD
jgi:hypothetical protein